MPGTSVVQGNLCPCPLGKPNISRNTIGETLDQWDVRLPPYAYLSAPVPEPVS